MPLILPRYSRSWITLTPQNGWSQYDSSWTHPENSAHYPPLQYLKDPFGVVHIRGLLTGGTVTNGTTVATLPRGFRPGSRLFFPTISNNVACRVDVIPDGTIFVNGTIDGSATTVSNVWVSFNGISFLAYN